MMRWGAVAPRWFGTQTGTRTAETARVGSSAPESPGGAGERRRHGDAGAARSLRSPGGRDTGPRRAPSRSPPVRRVRPALPRSPRSLPAANPGLSRLPAAFVGPALPKFPGPELGAAALQWQRAGGAGAAPRLLGAPSGDGALHGNAAPRVRRAGTQRHPHIWVPPAQGLPSLPAPLEHPLWRSVPAPPHRTAPHRPSRPSAGRVPGAGARGSERRVTACRRLPLRRRARPAPAAAAAAAGQRGLRRYGHRGLPGLRREAGGCRGRGKVNGARRRGAAGTGDGGDGDTGSGDAGDAVGGQHGRHGASAPGMGTLGLGTAGTRAAANGSVGNAGYWHRGHRE